MEEGHFNEEGRRLLKNEVKRRIKADDIKAFDSPVSLAIERFKTIEGRNAKKKEMYELTTVLDALRRAWDAVKITTNNDADLENALDQYVAQGQHIERWLKLVDDGGGEENQEAPEILAARDAIRNISPTEKGRWGKLLNEINKLGTIQGSRTEAYSAEELRDIINEIRLDPKKLNKLTNGGILGINNKVRAFLQVDGAKIE